MLVMLVVIAAVFAGATLGRALARRGITADNALRGRQALAYLILLGAASVGAALYYAPRLLWIPTAVALYGDASVLHVVRGLVGFALGLLVTLEWPGRRERRRLLNLAAGGAVLLVAAAYLAWRTVPVTGLLLASWIEDGIVMQTSPYTCAPSSIATLARLVLNDTTTTEASVAALAGTTREGTTTLAEIAAMRRLGLGPRFARGLTPDSLASVALPAVLHVDEPVGPKTIRHAVALMAVDGAARRITVGNPLRGRQVKRFDELQGWWTGEAVFATAAHR